LASEAGFIVSTSKEPFISS